jgi:hypothetical protein
VNGIYYRAELVLGAKNLKLKLNTRRLLPLLHRNAWLVPLTATEGICRSPDVTRDSIALPNKVRNRSTSATAYRRQEHVCELNLIGQHVCGVSLLRLGFASAQEPFLLITHIMRMSPYFQSGSERRPPNSDSEDSCMFVFICLHTHGKDQRGL